MFEGGAFRGIFEQTQQSGGATDQCALRQELDHDGTTGEVRIAVETDVDAFGVGEVDAVQGQLLLAPVIAAEGLKVRDLEAASGAAGEVDLLV